MRKEEKTRRTYERIMAAAMEEFGTKSYDNASITTLCNENQISKGLVYHNFKNKDELYLKCVEECFDEMTEYFKNQEYKADGIQESLQNLFHMRQQFFSEHPCCCNLFFYTVVQPPEHLRRKIHALRQKYDDFFINCFRELLQQTEMRDGITEAAAMEYFMIFLEMFNGYFQSRSCEKEDIHALAEYHEENLSKILDIMLYGVAKKNRGERTEK